MLDKYIKVIDKIKEEILFLTIDKDENGDDLFVMGRDFMTFKFKADDKLVYNQKINVPVCVISINSVFDSLIGIFHGFNYKNVFMKVIKISCFTLLKQFLIKNEKL